MRRLVERDDLGASEQLEDLKGSVPSKDNVEAVVILQTHQGRLGDKPIPLDLSNNL